MSSSNGAVTHIKDLKPDRKNRRKHNPRNISMIEQSLNEVGAGRSIVIDENNNILAGNGTVEAAAQAGITRVQVIEADGDTLIAVKRTGLNDEQKRKLALYDNRTAELAEWDIEQLLADTQAGMDFEGVFFPRELDNLLEAGAAKIESESRELSLPDPEQKYSDDEDEDEDTGDEGALAKTSKSREDKKYHFNAELEFGDSLLVGRALKEFGDDPALFISGAASAFLKGLWGEHRKRPA